MIYARLTIFTLGLLAWACAAPPITGTGASAEPASSDGDGPLDEDGSDDMTGTPVEDASGAGAGDGDGDGDAPDDPGGQTGGAFPFPQARAMPHCSVLDL